MERKIRENTLSDRTVRKVDKVFTALEDKLKAGEPLKVKDFVAWERALLSLPELGLVTNTPEQEVLRNFRLRAGRICTADYCLWQAQYIGHLHEDFDRLGEQLRNEPLSNEEHLQIVAERSQISAELRIMEQ